MYVEYLLVVPEPCHWGGAFSGIISGRDKATTLDRRKATREQLHFPNETDLSLLLRQIALSRPIRNNHRPKVRCPK